MTSWRSRIGDYRILYRIEDDRLIVLGDQDRDTGAHVYR